MQTYDTIRTRLQQQAASRFGRTPEALPQEVRLFIDWMSAELGGLHRELSRSNDAIQQHIQRRLTPDVQTRVQPAHVLLCAQPKKQNFMLDPEEHVFTLPRLGGDLPNELFYTPLVPVNLVTAKVKYALHQGGLYADMGQGQQQGLPAALNDHKALHPGVVWLGIQWDTPLTDARELCLHVDWKVEDAARSEKLYAMLPLVQWQHQALNLPRQMGLCFDSTLRERSKPKYIDEEYLYLYRIEKEALEAYQAQFVQLKLPNGLSNQLPVEVVEACTEVWNDSFQKEPLCWVKLIFPAGVSPAEIQQCQFLLNCFPVMNRRLDRTRDFRPYEDKLINLQPLSNADQGRKSLAEMGAFFLGIQRVFTRDMDYRPLTVQQFRDASPGSYALQRGRVEANDFRDLYARIAELTELIHDHASTLLLLPQSQLNQAMTSIKHGAETLENALKQIPAKDLDLGYYLHLKVLDFQDMIYIRFWITQGDYAQGVAKAGDFLSFERGGVFEGDVVWVV